MIESLRKNAKGICLMLFCSICLCLGQLSWKLMQEFNIIYLLVGFAFCGLGAIFMILAYRFGELSVLQPINSASFIFSLILAALVLHEVITVWQIIGVIVIICGIILIGGSDKK